MWAAFPLLRRRARAALAAAVFPAMASAATVPCPDGQVSVVADTRPEAEAVCARVTDSLELLSACNMPLTHPVTIELRAALSPGCMGIYHCAEERIEILTPEAMDKARNPDNGLAFVATPDYFHSILAHELAHAAYANAPCPFENCLATTEYLAHVFQVMSLPPADIARFEAGLDMQTPMGRDAINAMVYLMSPDAFMRRAWIHLQQRPDACAFIGEIYKGNVILDHERF